MAQGKISAKQEEILEYIKSQILERGFPPSVRDICEAVHLKSTSSVHSHLETLEKNGYIHRDPTKPRAIEILDDSFNFNRREMVNVPVIGHVAAGEPLLAEQNIENYFPIPMEYMPNKQTFMLKVHGESMINAGILDGDLVLVEQSSVADNGDIVVALLDDSATVKRFYKEEGIFRLQPENDALEPIIVRDLQIMGKVIGVFRFFAKTQTIPSIQAFIQYLFVVAKSITFKSPVQYIKYKTDNFERSERNQFYILYARGFYKIFYNNKLLLKFIYIINFLSIIPDPFQIIELTVFSIKNMHDHITEVNQYPCSASVSFCLFCSVACFVHLFLYILNKCTYLAVAVTICNYKIVCKYRYR